MADSKLSVPVIGICGGNSDSASVRAMMTQIAGTGAVPMFLGNHTNRDAEKDLVKIDALVVMGNNADIDPSEYNQPKNPATNSELVKKDTTGKEIPGDISGHQAPDKEGMARRNYETVLMQKALNDRMPILGVCGGMQRLNVMNGGTLHQHIPDLIQHNEHSQLDPYNIAPFVPVQPVHITSDTLLSDIAAEANTIFTRGHEPNPPGVIEENSMHHQAIDKIGKGLRVAATAEDTMPDDSKLVEAIEADPNGKYSDQFLVGVQWHPEFSASPFGAKLAQRVASEAKKFAEDHNRVHTWEDVQEENRISATPMVKLVPAEDKSARDDSFVGRLLALRRQFVPALG